MKTRARVVLVCELTSIIAAETPSGDITVLELLGCEKIRLGDVLAGYWTELDNQVVYNKTRDKHLEVFVHDNGCELDDVKKRFFTPRPEPAVIFDAPVPQTEEVLSDPSGFHLRGDRR